MKILITTGLLFAFCNPVFAECVINGVIYAEGSIVNNHICADGEWVKLES